MKKNSDTKQADKLQTPAVIFDLDGVIVDTAKFHYLAWKAVSDSEGIYFDEEINERLKGVSRLDSLKIIMERRQREYTLKELQNLAEKKNRLYRNMLEKLSRDDILPGIVDLIKTLRRKNIKLAIYSVSKNTDYIVDRLMIRFFDAIVTGNDITKPKPDPEGLILAAKKLCVPAVHCIVIEDASAGIEAAISAGMNNIGIGDKDQLHKADHVLSSTELLTTHFSR